MTSDVFGAAAWAMLTVPAGSLTSHTHVLQIPALSTETIRLRVCGPMAEVRVDIDGDTGVSAWLFGPTGRILLQDPDTSTDMPLRWVVRRPGGSCAAYSLVVRNDGSADDRVEVTLEDRS